MRMRVYAQVLPEDMEEMTAAVSRLRKAKEEAEEVRLQNAAEKARIERAKGRANAARQRMQVKERVGNGGWGMKEETREER